MKITSPLPVIDTSRAPFALPIDIVLDLPAPPSVNRMRKWDAASQRMVNDWKKAADKFVLTQRRGQPRKIYGAFAVEITMSEAHTGIDLDNGVKALIDYMRRIDAIENDSQKFLRKLTVIWGTAPEGCRVTVRPFA